MALKMAAFSFLFNNSKLETTQMSISTWTDKQIVSYGKGECYSTIKKNELFIYVMTFMNRKIIILSRKKPDHKVPTVWLFVWNSKTFKLVCSDGKQNDGYLGLKEVNGESGKKKRQMSSINFGR